MMTKEDISRIAYLTRIELTEAELERFAAEVSDVLAMADAMTRCPIRAYEEPADRQPPSGVLRPDVIEPGFTREKLLENAARCEAGCFIVPKTVEAE